MRKEIPILFSTPMVQAILDGRKTETRRVLKFNKKIEDPKVGYTAFTPERHISVRGVHESGQFGESFFRCPYGKRGDVLWVRETFMELGFEGNYVHKATFGCPLTDGDKWKPSIFMPKDAGRIWLEVESISVERLQDIKEESAIAEGIGYEASVYPPLIYNYLKKEWQKGGFPSAAFAGLWQSINGAESWTANPWVWVVKFKVLSTTGKPANL